MRVAQKPIFGGKDVRAAALLRGDDGPGDHSISTTASSFGWTPAGRSSKRPTFRCPGEWSARSAVLEVLDGWLWHRSRRAAGANIKVVAAHAGIFREKNGIRHSNSSWQKVTFNGTE
jgi:hypothetical protein